MLNAADNELLTRTGRGTPMGELFRRFWIPALLESEVPEAGAPPVKVGLLGEKLVAFRGADGQVGLLEARCPHRHANLYWGRNEEDGLRCVYHGWKFGFDGQCLEMPAEPEDSTYSGKVRAVAYPARAAGGIVWAYLGPETQQPPFPDLEWTKLPGDWFQASKRLQRCNWFQNVEGELDTAHVQFLHRNLAPRADVQQNRIQSTLAKAENPQYTIAEEPFGMLAVAERQMPEENAKYWRITPFLMPSFTMVPAQHMDLNTFTAAVPVDDENMWGFTVTWRNDRPFDDADRQNYADGQVLHVQVDPETFIPLANRENNFGLDREMQRTVNFSGIAGIRNQDLPVQEDQDGPVCDRSTEHLGTTDRAIVAARRLVIRAAKELAGGKEPSQPHAAASYYA
ncbi:MAG: Rieske 2Fe-2S domain-containing protein, partial [Streptosporangiales bacterium]|nr:Rieske 2Fe-2S domain-containing protein [Streptosporangiales bacterium]